MNAPKISVLMPIYNTQEEFLREAVSSILSQTCKDFEFLILNDSPENKKLDYIVKSYGDSRIKYFNDGLHRGISDARNKLISLAEGEYLAVMDHDDISLPERLMKQVKFLDEHPEVGVCGSAFLKMPENKTGKTPVSSEAIKKTLMLECVVHHPSAMIRKAVLLNNGIKYEKAFSPAEDYALWCRLIGKTEFYNLPEVLIKYRRHRSQTSMTQKSKMAAATEMVHAFVHKDHPEIWQYVLNNAPCVTRVKLFGFVPILKFRHTGLVYRGMFKFFPCLKIKTKWGICK